MFLVTNKILKKLYYRRDISDITILSLFILQIGITVLEEWSLRFSISTSPNLMDSVLFILNSYQKKNCCFKWVFISTGKWKNPKHFSNPKPRQKILCPKKNYFFLKKITLENISHILEWSMIWPTTQTRFKTFFIHSGKNLY